MLYTVCFPEPGEKQRGDSHPVLALEALGVWRKWRGLLWEAGEFVSLALGSPVCLLSLGFLTPENGHCRQISMNSINLIFSLFCNEVLGYVIFGGFDRMRKELD